MNLHYEYIHFVKIEHKASVWSARNNRTNAELGKVRWFGSWPQYVFVTAPGAVFSASCLIDVRHFIEQLMAERKEELQA